MAGTVTGVRFYKQTWMGGYTHVGHLWSSTGTLLATATFTNETASGWQQVNFSSPVAISANTVYIVSFSTGGGYFGITHQLLHQRRGRPAARCTPWPTASSGGDGVYHSGNGSFPSVSGSGMNFWADVAFSPSSSHERQDVIRRDLDGSVELDDHRTIGPLRHSGRRGRAVGADGGRDGDEGSDGRKRACRRPRPGRAGPRRTVMQSRTPILWGPLRTSFRLIADGSRPHRTAHRGSESPRWAASSDNSPHFSRPPIA